MKAITRKRALEIANKSDYAISDYDGRTFYATNEIETVVYEFDSKRDRDRVVMQSNTK